MQITIAICDDNDNDRKTIYDFAQNYGESNQLSFNITTFTCGEDFLKAAKDVSFDIVFMDIYMDGIKGTETIASCKSDNMQTVFTTTSREYAIEAFSLNAAHYLLKPVKYEDFQKAMERCLATKNVQSFPTLEVKTNNGIASISIKKITHIEVYNKTCLIHTNDKTYEVTSSLDALFEMLDSNLFMRAQRSYIVNMDFIESFHYDHVVLDGGKEIVLSRNARAKLKSQYQQFLFNLARKETL